MTAGKDEQSSHVAECAAPKPPAGMVVSTGVAQSSWVAAQGFQVVYPEPQRFHAARI